jgi:hypothetical protein
MGHFVGCATHTLLFGKDVLMSNRTHFILAVIIVAAILLDVTFDSSAAMMFLLRKLVDLIDYLAFWR